MITVNTRSAREDRFYDNYKANATKKPLPLDYRNIFMEQGFKKESTGHYTKQLSADFALDAKEDVYRKYVAIRLLIRGMLPLDILANREFLGDIALRSLDGFDPGQLDERNILYVKAYTPEQVKETIDKLQKVFEDQRAKGSISSEAWKDEALHSAFLWFSVGKAHHPTDDDYTELLKMAVNNPEMTVSEIYEDYFHIRPTNKEATDSSSADIEDSSTEDLRGWGDEEVANQNALSSIAEAIKQAFNEAGIKYGAFNFDIFDTGSNICIQGVDNPQEVIEFLEERFEFPIVDEGEDYVIIDTTQEYEDEGGNTRERVNTNYLVAESQQEDETAEKIKQLKKDAYYYLGREIPDDEALEILDYVEWKPESSLAEILEAYYGIE